MWFLFSILLAVSFCEMPSASAQISVSPSRIFFEGKPGETVMQVVTLHNEGQKEYEFNINLKDWNRDSSGIKVYAEAGTMPLSNANYISLNQSMITLQPGESKDVPVHLQIPAAGLGTLATNSMLFFTQNVKEEQASNIPSIGIKVGFEYGIQLFYNPYGAQVGDLEFLSFDLLSKAQEGSEKKGIQIKYNNSGQVNKMGVLKIELTHKVTGEEVILEPTVFAIMPTAEQGIFLEFPEHLKAGDYLAIAMMTSDSNERKNNIKIAKKDIHVD